MRSLKKKCLHFVNKTSISSLQRQPRIKCKTKEKENKQFNGKICSVVRVCV